MATFPNVLNRVWLDKAIEERPTRPTIRQGYLYPKFFPFKTVYAYDLTWDMIKAGNRLAGLYAHDGVPIPGDDYDFLQRLADIMHLMASRTIGQDTIMKLRDAGELAIFNNLAKGLRQRYVSKVQERLGNCQDEIEGTLEYLCMGALQGTIRWPPVDATGAAIVNPPASWGDIGFTMSMGFRPTFIQNVSTLVGHNARTGGGFVWTDAANSDPVQDMEVVNEYVEETTGISMDGATLIMSRTVLSRIAFNANVLRWIRGDTGPPPDTALKYVDVSLLKNYIKTKLGYNIVTYDARWTYPTQLGAVTGTVEQMIKFLNEGVVIIIPQGALAAGYAYLATAPDLGGNEAAGRSPDKGGLYTWFWKMPKPPWTAELGVGIHAFPIMKSTQEIFVLDVFN